MSDTSTPIRPSYEVFFVEKKDDAEKGTWTKVGVLWEHADGEGFNLQLTLIPRENTPLVIRRPKPKTK